MGQFSPNPSILFLLKSFGPNLGFGTEDLSSVSWDQIRKIAEDKMVDLNAFTVESAMKMVAGTARSMGLNVKGPSPF